MTAQEKQKENKKENGKENSVSTNCLRPSSEDNDNLSFDTRRIHAGYNPAEHGYSAQVPIYQSVGFVLGDSQRGRELADGKIPGFTYSRVGNPTTAVFEQRMASLDGGVSAVAVGSGMAAITNTIFNVAEGGGRIVTHHDIYGASLDEFVSFAPKFGINVDFVDDINDVNAVRAAITPDTKAIYAESVTNPRTIISNIDQLAEIAHENGIPLIVDNTFPTPYLFRPIEHGADIVVYSSTKGINGHGNAVSGVIVDAGNFDWSSPKFPQFNEPEFTQFVEGMDHVPSFVEIFGREAFHQRIRDRYVRLFGAVLGPQEAYLELIGLETISERLSKQVSNAVKVAQYLEQSPHVTRVNYSGLESNPQYELGRRLFPRGIGSIFSFEVSGTNPADAEERVNRIIDAVHVFIYVPNVGDARSLIVNPVRTTHRETPPEFKENDGLSTSLIRLSIGLEDANDLIADLDQAIATAYGD